MHNFIPLETDEARKVENEARMRGMYKAFLGNLAEFYSEWIKTNEDNPFIVPLNANEGDIFFGKGTDSLYTGINYAINKAELKEEWRLIKREGNLLIAHK